MTERDAIFRERLIALMTALRGGDSKDAALRRLVGTYAQRLSKQGNAKSWSELKKRVNPAAYDSMLRLFQRESEEFQKKGDSKAVRALEVLAISLIARHQQQADMAPGVGFLDAYIEESEELAKRTAAPFLNARPTAH